jgi:hypothetical protein
MNNNQSPTFEAGAIYPPNIFLSVSLLENFVGMNFRHDCLLTAINHPMEDDGPTSRSGEISDWSGAPDDQSGSSCDRSSGFFHWSDGFGDRSGRSRDRSGRFFHRLDGFGDRSDRIFHQSDGSRDRSK